MTVVKFMKLLQNFSACDFTFLQFDAKQQNRRIKNLQVKEKIPLVTICHVLNQKLKEHCFYIIKLIRLL